MIHALGHVSGYSAVVVLCAILFAEECGVPLPILPGDMLLVGAGILAAGGRVSLLAVILATTVAMCGGALVGHAWSAAAGRTALRRAAARLGAVSLLDRATARIRAGGWAGVAACRLIPGMRVYANLAAGAAGVRRRTFVAGLVPSVLAWTIGFTVLGAVAGHRVERLLGLARGIVPGVLLAAVVLVALGVLARTLPGRHPARTPSRQALRLVGAAILDLGIAAAAIAALVEGLEAALKLSEPAAVTADILLVGAGAVTYLLVARGAAGATAGEGVLRVTYRRRAGTSSDHRVGE